MVMSLLQIGVPGAVELSLLLIVFAVIGVLVGWWIYGDARMRGSAWAWQWGVGVGFLFVLGFLPGIGGVVLYLLVRPDRVDQ